MCASSINLERGFLLSLINIFTEHREQLVQKSTYNQLITFQNSILNTDFFVDIFEFLTVYTIPIYAFSIKFDAVQGTIKKISDALLQFLFLHQPQRAMRHNILRYSLFSLLRYPAWSSQLQPSPRIWVPVFEACNYLIRVPSDISLCRRSILIRKSVQFSHPVICLCHHLSTSCYLPE